MHSSFKRTCFFICLLPSFVSFAQTQKNDSTTPVARVNVTVTNFNLQPLKKAQVLFISENKRKVRSGTADEAGKFSMELPAGERYQIRLKTMKDTVNYSLLEIPPLGPGEYFDDAITINIKYDPPRTFTLDNVLFDTGKPTLRPESYRELDEIAAYMKLKEDEVYEVAGHTDNVGSDEANLKLSQQRAEAVKNYLVKKGVRADRLTAKGYGASRPLADNATAEGRQKNRRTEVIIL